MTTGGGKQLRNTTCWKNRTTLERILICLATFFTLVVICLIIVLARLSIKESDLCLTPSCVNAASEVFKYIDPKIDPCDDFYEFSCGKFLRDTYIPDDKTSISASHYMYDLLIEQVKKAISEPIKPDDIKTFRLIKTLYKSCMNTTRIEEQGLGPIKRILQDFGGWPVLEGNKWNERDFDWKQILYSLRHKGMFHGFLFNLDIGIDAKNNTKRILTLDQASLGLIRKLLIKGFEEKLVKAYYEYMVDVAIIFGADKLQAQKELKSSLEFEIKLANISIAMEDRRNASLEYNLVTIDELQGMFPSIPWLKFINMMLSPQELVDSREIINVQLPKFFKDFEDLIRRTPKRVLGNYLSWRTVESIAFYLTEEIRKRRFKFVSIVSGKIDQRPRWKDCVSVASDLYIASGALYVRKYFQSDTKEKVMELVTDIQDTFTDMLKDLNWIDSKTKKRALEKANAMEKYIGYPDELMDDEKLEEHYKDLEINQNHLLLSKLNMTLFSIENAIKLFRKPVNKTDWKTHTFPDVINAFYSFDENSIQFPAGILQGIYFNKERPFYMNFGGIGYVIGHEITHGFDDEGRQYDKEGNLKDWWEPETKAAYLKKAQCIIDQYGNISIPEVKMNINGINTQGENIADNGGIKEAYLAYEKWVKRNGEEKILPGLQFTQKQLFWITAGISWCDKYRAEAMKITLLTDYHAPTKYRVIIPFSNTEYFAKDFNCPLNSKMNPKHKCTVW